MFFVFLFFGGLGFLGGFGFLGVLGFGVMGPASLFQFVSSKGVEVLGDGPGGFRL